MTIKRYCVECGGRVEAEDVEIDLLGTRPSANAPVPPPRVTLHPCGHHHAMTWQTASIDDDTVRQLVEMQRRRCILATDAGGVFNVKEIMSLVDVLEDFMDGDR